MSQLLLIEDIENLGRSGEIVAVKPGYARNFLLPQKKAVIANKGTIRLQQRLQEERAKKATVDKADAQKLAQVLKDVSLETIVKVDGAGHMYGSVTAQDVAQLLCAAGYEMTKKNIVLPQAIKKTGMITVNLKLKEGVPASIQLNVIPDRVIQEAVVEAPQEVSKEAVQEEQAEEASEQDS